MRVDPFTGLAPLYDAMGMARYSEDIAPQLIETAFAAGWIGRTMLDVGCGTGGVACYLARQGYRVFACDSSSAMLNIGVERAKPDSLMVEWLHGSAQSIRLSTALDLALMLGGTLNLLPGLADIEQVFARMAAALDPGKLFIFDLDTMHGLIEARSTTEILYNVPDEAFVVAQNQISYEQLIHTTEYTIFHRNPEDDRWSSAREVHIQHALPVAAIRRYLSKAGFSVLNILSAQDLKPVDPEQVPRIVLIAQKQPIDN